MDVNMNSVTKEQISELRATNEYGTFAILVRDKKQRLRNEIDEAMRKGNKVFVVGKQPVSSDAKQDIIPKWKCDDCGHTFFDDDEPPPYRCPVCYGIKGSDKFLRRLSDAEADAEFEKRTVDKLMDRLFEEKLMKLTGLPKEEVGELRRKIVAEKSIAPTVNQA